MNAGEMIERVKEELPGQVIWLQSATDERSAFAEGLAITMTGTKGLTSQEAKAGATRRFTVSYFRVFPSYGGFDGDIEPADDELPEVPYDCTVEIGYENPWADIEDAKEEALGLLPYLPKPAYLAHTRADISLTSLRELEAPEL